MLSREEIGRYVRAGDASAPENEDMLSLFVSQQTARSLWGSLGSWEKIEKSSPEDLASYGLTPSEIAKIGAIFEISRRRSTENVKRGTSVGCSEDAWRILAPIMRSLPIEKMVVVPLDTRHRLTRSPIIVAQGGGSRCCIEPKDILRPLLISGANAFLLAHNHPSGDPEPSAEDELLTKTVREAAEILGLRLLDHIVIGGHGFVSMADRGVM